MPFPANVKLAAGALRGCTLDTTVKSMRQFWAIPEDGHPNVFCSGAGVWLSDGYLIRAGTLRSKQRGTLDLKALIAEAIAGQRGATGVDGEGNLHLPQLLPRLFDDLRELLALAKAAGANVMVISTAVHPDLEDAFGRAKLHVSRREFFDRLETICAEQNARFRDFSSLASYQGDPCEFWDPWHQTSENIRRMTNVMFGIDPAKPVTELPADSDLLDQLPPDIRNRFP